MRWSVKKAVFLITILCLCIVTQFQIPSSLAAEKVKEKPYYVGMEKCKECHPEHIETYSHWKYSRNFRILELREMADDPRCLPCHTTGYGKPGGFVSVEKTPHMKNIQCETCHGPASLHLKAPTIEEHQRTLNIPVNICTTCHRQHKHMGY
ncbi:MAG: hypothetical protein KAV87_29280 [Desulfobacteraceae bacterium]|nr:hypothetical protein [Desulfobacteraceae bacterium]